MKINAKGPDDLVAALPYLLGFTPQDSVVLVPVSPGMPAARVDMPYDEADRAIMADQLTAPFLRHAHTAGPDPMLALVCLTEDREAATKAAEAVADALWPRVSVPVKVWATDRDWTNLDTGEQGVRTTEASSRLAAEAVAAGRQLPAAAREDLARTLTGEDRDALRGALPGALAALETSGLDQERRWAENRINRFLDDGIALPEADAARLLVGVQALPVRDAALAMMTQEDHHAHRALWTDLTRRAPDEVRAPAATMLAFSAWLGGDGAGAWTALDQIPAEQSDYRLAGLMSSVLESAVPPSQWTTTIRPALLAHDAEPPSPPARDMGRDHAGHSPDLNGAGVRPRPEQQPLPQSAIPQPRPPAR
ncbi:DUF4192 domain-containing protein [Nocardioides marmoraquaticus]